MLLQYNRLQILPQIEHVLYVPVRRYLLENLQADRKRDDHAPSPADGLTEKFQRPRVQLDAPRR